jgi:hypothetical protein
VDLCVIRVNKLGFVNVLSIPTIIMHVQLCTLLYRGIPPIAQQPSVGQGLLITEASRSHSGTPHSIGLLWTNDQPVAETSTWQQTTLTRDRHPCPREIRTHNPSKRAATDPRLGPRCHWDRHIGALLYVTTVASNFVSAVLTHEASTLNEQRVCEMWRVCELKGNISSSFFKYGE